jgi:hypothetical protein
MSKEKSRVPAPEPSEEEDSTTLVERPDGYYWQSKLTGKWYGPFPTMLEATEDAQYNEDGDYDDGDSLQEAEDVIGMAGWIDADTGAPAEGTTLHLCDE